MTQSIDYHARGIALAREIAALPPGPWGMAWEERIGGMIGTAMQEMVEQARADWLAAAHAALECAAVEVGELADNHQATGKADRARFLTGKAAGLRAAGGTIAEAACPTK